MNTQNCKICVKYKFVALVLSEAKSLGGYRFLYIENFNSGLIIFILFYTTLKIEWLILTIIHDPTRNTQIAFVCTLTYATTWIFLISLMFAN